jgi:ATP-binding cassette subfamily B protein
MALTNVRVDFATSMVSFERVFEVLDLPQEIHDPPVPVRLEKVSGHVAFDDVWFSYQGQDDRPVGLEEVRRFRRNATYIPKEQKEKGDSDRPGEGTALPPIEPEVRWALRGVSFEIRPGEVAALVGPSGAGKTTITYLVPRLYDPLRGQVKLDGQDLRQLSLDELAEHIGMVTQETYLFHDSLMTNLLYARPGAAMSEVEAACRAANIHEFIASLPEGYETVVGERGYRLSGGEKQRVAIARVILKDPRVLILDEATSHLDSQSEALIQDAMQKVMQGRTSIVIAHRLSTVRGADQILVMQKGQLVQRGRHEDLLTQGGLYANLYETQFHPQTSPV